MNTTQQQNSLQQLKELTNKIIVRESSREAHEAIKPVKEEHYKEILEALKNIGKEATGKTIAKFSSLTYHQVMRRVSEMEKKKIYLDGKVVTKKTIAQDFKLPEIKTLTQICNQLGKIKTYNFKVKFKVA